MQIKRIYTEYRTLDIKGTTKVVTTFLSTLSRDKDSFPLLLKIYTDFYQNENVCFVDDLLTFDCCSIRTY